MLGYVPKNIWANELKGLNQKKLYVYHTWKKVGILATGCQRFGTKNDAKGQKRRKMAKNDTKRQKHDVK